MAATFEENERPIHRLNMHLYLVEHTITKKRRVVMRKPKCTVRDSNTFQAAVQKTTDGGDTWTTLFNHTGQYYPNGIQFITEDVRVLCAL